MNLVKKIKDSYQNKMIPTNELISYAEKCDDYALGKITSSEIQTEICKYMDASATRSRALSRVLGRTKEPPLADVFTEATNMLVYSIMSSKKLAHLSISVFSEKNLRLPTGGFRKPDVSLWKDNKLIGIVECKTCLGHRRNDWLNDYDRRVDEFSSFGLDSKSIFLFVETEQTWGGFPKSDIRTSSSWFTLCPKGSWHGGGKTGEELLHEKQYPDVVEKFKNSLVNVVLEKC